MKPCKQPSHLQVMPEGEDDEETGKRSLRGRTKVASVGSRSTASGSAPRDSSLARSSGVLHSLILAAVQSLPASATRLQSSLGSELIGLTGSSISRRRRCFCFSLKFIFTSCPNEGGGLEIRKVLKSPAVTWLFLFLPGTDDAEDKRVRFRSPRTTGRGSFSSCTFSCLLRREEEEEREERRANEEEMWLSSWEEYGVEEEDE